MVPAINAEFIIDWIGSFSSMFLFSGFMGVDTFFMLSALLMTLSIFRELDKT
jgi:peptidoglycan/LPS O-acetylase OafA/YrhL